MPSVIKYVEVEVEVEINQRDIENMNSDNMYFMSEEEARETLKDASLYLRRWGQFGLADRIDQMIMNGS